MKKENVLFISLGRSPAVVPETLDALLEKNIKIKRTYLITTNDDTIWNDCIPLIEEDFNAHYKSKNMELDLYSCTLMSDDIYNEKDNLELMRKVAGLFKREKNNNIYISMAGGRKTMSAAMALLAQIYNARAITHVLVPQEIESYGNIFQLTKLNKREQQKILHPKEKRLIFFPVIGISWMLDDIINALKGKELKPSRHEIINILQENGLIDQEKNQRKWVNFLTNSYQSKNIYIWLWQIKGMYVHGELLFSDYVAIALLVLTIVFLLYCVIYRISDAVGVRLRFVCSELFVYLRRVVVWRLGLRL